MVSASIKTSVYCCCAVGRNLARSLFLFSLYPFCLFTVWTMVALHGHIVVCRYSSQLPFFCHAVQVFCRTWQTGTTWRSFFFFAVLEWAVLPVAPLCLDYSPLLLAITYASTQKKDIILIREIGVEQDAELNKNANTQKKSQISFSIPASVVVIAATCMADTFSFDVWSGSCQERGFRVYIMTTLGQ